MSAFHPSTLLDPIHKCNAKGNEFLISERSFPVCIWLQSPFFFEACHFALFQHYSFLFNSHLTSHCSDELNKGKLANMIKAVLCHYCMSFCMWVTTSYTHRKGHCHRQDAASIILMNVSNSANQVQGFASQRFSFILFDIFRGQMITSVVWMCLFKNCSFELKFIVVALKYHKADLMVWNMSSVGRILNFVEEEIGQCVIITCCL